MTAVASLKSRGFNQRRSVFPFHNPSNMGTRTLKKPAAAPHDPPDEDNSTLSDGSDLGDVDLGKKRKKTSLGNQTSKKLKVRWFILSLRHVLISIGRCTPSTLIAISFTGVKLFM